MIFKHLIQLLFAIVQRIFRPMNASQNAKPSIPPTEEGNRLPPQVGDTQLTLTAQLLGEQAHQPQRTPSGIEATVEQFTAAFDEIVQEEPLLQLDLTDLPSPDSLPTPITEQISTAKEQAEESTATSSPDLTSQPFEKEYIEISGEKLPLTAVIESILFVADTPVSPAQLAKVLHFDLNQIESGLQALGQMYEQNRRGLRLQERDGKFLLITIPAAATVIEDFLNLDTSAKLSTPALETLAVIAYRQPITRMQIEAVRGVDSAGVLRSLVQRGLVEEMGRLEVAGRPFLYGVTDLFMQHFGLTKIEDLPPLQSSEADTLWATTKLAELTELVS